MKIGDEPQIVAHPYMDTKAAIMLHDGLRRASRERGLSLRALAEQLRYKQATVLSHMSTGRIPIPLERAPEIARAVGIDPGEFLAAAVAQRNAEATGLIRSTAGADSLTEYGFVTELKLLAGVVIDELNEEQKSVVREVVADPGPARRWLSIAELQVMLTIRKLRPDIGTKGLSGGDLEAIGAALTHRT